VLSVKRAALLLLVAACGDPGQLGRGIVTPNDVTARVALEDVPVTGSEVSVVRTDDTKVTGELLEANEDRVTLLKDGALVVIRADEIRRAIVTRYENGGIVTALAGWSAATGATQLTHGVFWLVSGPIWGGISAGVIAPVAADEGRFAYAERRSDLTFLQEYARFPQGLPAEYRRR
jgi:hypothetical protein